MSVHLNRQIERLKKMILQLGTLVEENLELAIRCVREREYALGDQVVLRDREVDLMALDLEEECLHTLALNQPVAFDLRYVVAVLKMNNELERIGDMSVNVAEQGRLLATTPEVPGIPFDIDLMALKTRSMLKNSLDALVNIDQELAQKVIKNDQEVNDIHRGMYVGIELAIESDFSYSDQYLHYMLISKNMERIADHACNIAEDVIYMARGESRSTR